MNIKISKKKVIGVFNCPKCGNTFTRKNNMVIHINKYCKNKDVIDPNVELKQEIIELKKKVEILETKNNSTINNGTINNGNINNIIYINKPGTEN